MRWDEPFDVPITLPGGKTLVALRDAGEYITKLPKADQAAKHWQTAMHVLIQAADHGGPISFARIGMMQALHRDPPVYDTARKDTHWGKRRLARDR